MAEVLLFAVEVAPQQDKNVHPYRAAIHMLQGKLAQFAVAKDELLENLKTKQIPDGATNVDFAVTYDTPKAPKVQKYKRGV